MIFTIDPVPALKTEDVAEAAAALRRDSHSLILDTRPRRRAGRDAGGAA